MAEEPVPIDRATIAAEAARLEAAGADWKIKHVMAVLGVARSTAYDTPWLMRISRRVGKNGRRWTPSEVRTAQLLASSGDQKTFQRTGS